MNIFPKIIPTTKMYSMPMNLQTLYICHLILTVALGNMKYYSHFTDKGTGTAIAQIGMTSSCLSRFMFYGSSLLGRVLGAQLPQYYQVLTAPITKVRGSPASGWPPQWGLSPRGPSALLSGILLSQVLDQWFESEPLKATLATDAVIGAMTSPHTPGSG